MKIIKIGNPQIIMSNPDGKHNYFAWPTAAKLQNGKIAVVASGFRLRHVCPFGKTVIAYSDDDGETYSEPVSVIDTVLDDRDGGILSFGENGVIVTSFNNTVAFQKSIKEVTDYDLKYLNTITKEQEEEALGSSFRISFDGGSTFGRIFKSPVTSPHGPLEMNDGTLLWVGCRYDLDGTKKTGENYIEAHVINKDGTMQKVGEIENVKIGDREPLCCEPHAIMLEDGTILAHIRVQIDTGERYFTVYQSKSKDNGKTWSKPRQIISRLGGSPPHLLRLKSGLIICTYGYRENPSGIKASFSRDNGENWESGYDIHISASGWDIGYPSTLELADGSCLTVFYEHPSKNSPAVIVQQKWRIEND